MAEYKGIKGFKVQYLDQDPVPTVAGWSSGGALNTGRSQLAGAGTQTAGLAFGGAIVPVGGSATEEYNGSTWTTSPGSLATARESLAGCGTQTSALAFGGFITAATAATEEWTGAGAPLTQTITVS